MALKFDMGNQQSIAKALLAQQQGQTRSQVGQDIGSAIGGFGKWYSQNKSKVGKKYQRYLTDKSNFDMRETIPTEGGKQLSNPNYGKWKGPMQSFSQYRSQYRSDNRTKKIINKMFIKDDNKLDLSGVNEGEYSQILKDKFKAKVIQSKKDLEVSSGGTAIYNPGIPLTNADYDAVLTDADKKGVLQDYLQTESGQELIKDKRTAKRKDFFQGVGEDVKSFGQNVGEFGKTALPFAAGIGAVANPPLAAILGGMYGFSKLPGTDKRRNDGFSNTQDQLTRKEIKENMIKTHNLEKTPGAKGFFQRVIPGGDLGYRAKEKGGGSGQISATKAGQLQSSASPYINPSNLPGTGNPQTGVPYSPNQVVGPYSPNQAVGYGQYGQVNPFLPDIDKPDSTGGVFDDWLYQQTQQTNAALGRFYPTQTKASIYGVGGPSTPNLIKGQI